MTFSNGSVRTATTGLGLNQKKPSNYKQGRGAEHRGQGVVHDEIAKLATTPNKGVIKVKADNLLAE